MSFIVSTFVLLMIYLIVSIPFKVMEIIPGFTDIRPVAMLQPVYGIFFGIATVSGGRRLQELSRILSDPCFSIFIGRSCHINHLI